MQNIIWLLHRPQPPASIFHFSCFWVFLLDIAFNIFAERPQKTLCTEKERIAIKCFFYNLLHKSVLNVIVQINEIRVAKPERDRESLA